MRTIIAATVLVAVALSGGCSTVDEPDSLVDEAGYHVRDNAVYYLNPFPGKAFEIDGADAATFDIIDRTYARDSGQVYINGYPLPGAQPGSFELLERPGFVKVSRRVYQHDQPISTDPGHFELLPGGLSKDSSRVYASDGAVLSADVLVGADGIHSGVRRLVFGPEESFRVFKHHYYAVASADLAVGERLWTTFYNEPGRSAAVFRAETGQALMNFMFRSNNPLSYDYRDVAAQRRLLTEAFAGMGWHVPQLLAAADAAEDFYFDALDQVQMPSWSKGRVVLVGDAAYCASPASGAGALLALSGAYRLAGEIAVGGSITAALDRYEAAQRPLVTQKQSGLFTNISVPRTRLGILARNMLLSTRLTSYLLGHQSDQPRSLREYAFADRNENSTHDRP